MGQVSRPNRESVVGVNSTVLELDIADHAVVDSPTRLRSCQRRGGYPSPF